MSGTAKALFIFSAACAWAIFSGEGWAKDWSPATSISMTHYGPSALDLPLNASSPVATFSNDRRYFYILKTRGRLDCDCIERGINIYDAAAVQSLILKGPANHYAPI